ncbi:MAG: molybdopterin-dependent oxidoreductase, partial [Fimbriimonadaceae bacterium]|nr:molybdopterin-dependent oxidoreductase [Fimbriimonadaceae bacterium]
MNPELSRRSVIKVGVAATAGLILGCRIRESAAATPQGAADPFAPNAWLRVAPSGEVFITVAKPDIGTGVRTSLAMIVAEELGVAWESVKVEQAVADAKYGSMMIGGSTSVRSSWRPLREAGAAARAMLIEALMTNHPHDCPV